MAGTRERIVEAAASLILGRGIGNVTVVDIERASGLAPGSGAFYRHFDGKGAVYVAVIRREAERALDSFPDVGVSRSGVEELAVRMDLVERMRRLLVCMMRDDGQHPDARAAMADALLRLGRAAALDGVGGADPLAVEMVVVLAQIGYVLALEFFGDLPFGVSTERYVAALAELVEARPQG